MVRKIVIKICKYCGNTYSTRNSKYFCSYKCFSDSRRRYKKCKNCENVFRVKGKKYCCCQKCSREYRTKTVFRRKWLDGDMTDTHSIRTQIILEFGDKCSKCNIAEWQNNSITFHVDHIDGNPDNNQYKNHRLLCPNCHSQTPTYKGGNKKKPKMDKRNIKLRKIYKLKHN